MKRAVKKDLSSEQLNEYRVLHITASSLLPLLEKRKEVAYQKLIGEFRNSKTADLALVAECNAYTSLLDEIGSKLAAYERLSKE